MALLNRIAKSNGNPDRTVSALRLINEQLEQELNRCTARLEAILQLADFSLDSHQPQSQEEATSHPHQQDDKKSCDKKHSTMLMLILAILWGVSAYLLAPTSNQALAAMIHPAPITVRQANIPLTIHTEPQITATTGITIEAGLSRNGIVQAAAITTTGVLIPQIDAGQQAVELALALASVPTVISSANFIAQPSMTAAAVFTVPLTSFPRQGESYAVLSTGDTGSISFPGTFASTSWTGLPVRGNTDFDVTILQVDLSVPVGVNCLGLDFQFLSEEYPIFVDSSYNDAFIGELDNSTWTTYDSNITAPNNFIFDAEGNPITINSVVGLDAANGTGTSFDGQTNDFNGGATGLLTARTPITPGPHRLYLSIFDQGDQYFDSAVLIDNLVLFNALNCQEGVIAKPKLYLPILLKDLSQAPDLVVDNLVANNEGVRVIIKNIGNASVSQPFWVDVYIDPHTAPPTINQHWWQLADQGLVWGVTAPLLANETLTLTIGDPYYSTWHSRFNGSLSEHMPIWAQVDSVNLNTANGGVAESNESNNVGGPVLPLATVDMQGIAPSAGEPQPGLSENLPPR